MEQNFLVVGLARSGIAATNLLIEKNKNVYVYDSDKKKIYNLLKSNELNQKAIIVKKINNKLLNNIDTIVLSPGIKTEDWQEIAYKHNNKLVSELELASQFCPCKICAITGTNGKTTTTMLLAKILEDSKITTFVVGNIGTAFSGEIMKMKNENIAVCEVSSFQLENIQTFKPNVVGFLNISPDHLDRYKTFEDYKKAKLNIFKNLDNSCTAVLNFDDENVKNFCFSNFNSLFFSINSKIPNNLNGAYLQKNSLIFSKKGENIGKISLKNIKLKGLHNIENILCACLMAYVLGVSFNSMEKSLNNFIAPSHRLEYVGCLASIKFYNDSKATNIASSLSALKSFKEDIFLLMGGSDKGENFALFFNALPTNVKKIFVYGRMANKIMRHAAIAGYNSISSFENLEQAFTEAVKNAYENCVILLSPACASFDQFKNYEERGEYFKFLVQEILK